jgi:putative aldouronate transport system substrate-binding protein
VDFLIHVTSPDGEIYGVPSFSQDMGNEHQPKAWYYEPWLQKIGAKVPTTTEEFRSVLRKVVTTDLNGNGRVDEIGMIGTFGNMDNVWDLNFFSLRSYVQENTSAFLAGNKDIDSSWNTYVNDINTIGLSRVLGIIQNVYDRMYK